MPYCPHCAYEYDAGARVCPDCNTSLLEGEPILCPSCEGSLEGSAIFCPHCGVFLAWSSEEEEHVMCDHHKDVPATGRCVICGTAVCSSCAVMNQGKHFCSNDDHIGMAFDWVSVYTTGVPYEADLLRGNLEGAGIPVTILSQNDRMYFLTVGDLAVTKIMVPKERAGEALRFIHSMDAEPSTDAE